jgi:hypothetical protein
MQRYLAALTVVLLLSIVLVRVAMLQRQGVRAMNFGKQDKTDFLIPPFAFFYFYLILADAFGWPTVSRQTFFALGATAWLGVALCVAGLLFLVWSLVSFGRSFRVGIDDEKPDKLAPSQTRGSVPRPTLRHGVRGLLRAGAAVSIIYRHPCPPRAPDAGAWPKLCRPTLDSERGALF